MNGPSPESVETRSAACRAATRVSKRPSSTAMSTIVFVTPIGCCVGIGDVVATTSGVVSSSEEQATRTIVMAPINKRAPNFFIIVLRFVNNFLCANC